MFVPLSEASRLRQVRRSVDLQMRGMELRWEFVDRRCHFLNQVYWNLGYGKREEWESRKSYTKEQAMLALSVPETCVCDELDTCDMRLARFDLDLPLFLSSRFEERARNQGENIALNNASCGTTTFFFDLRLIRKPLEDVL